MALAEQKNRKTFFAYLLFYVAVVLIVSINNTFVSVDRALFDISQTVFADEEMAPEIVLVAIDDNSLLRIGEWPWPRQKHADLIAYLQEADAIVFDVLFSGYSNVVDDQALVAAVSRSGNVILPVYLSQLAYSGQLFEELPFPELASVAAGMGHVHVEHDADGIVRSVYLRQGLGEAYWKHIALEAYISSGGEDVEVEEQKTAKNQFLIAKDQHYYIAFNKAGSFARVSYADVLDGVVPKSFFKGKTVIVGATATGLGDQLSVPLMQNDRQMSGVEVNANILYALQYEQLISKIPTGLNVLLTLMVALTLVLVFSRLSNKGLVLASVSVAMGFALLEMLALQWFSCWLTMSSLIFSSLLCYFLWTWLRFEKVIRFFRAERALLEQGSQLAYQQLSRSSIEYAFDMLLQMGLIEHWQFVTYENESLDHNAYVFHDKGNIWAVTVVWSAEETCNQALLAAVKGNLSKYAHQTLTQKKDSVSDPIDRYIEELQELQSIVSDFQSLVGQSISLLKEGVVIVDVSGRLIFSNKVYRDWFGETENLSQLFDFIDADTPWMVIFESYILGQQASQYSLIDKRMAELRYLQMQGGIIENRLYGGLLVLLSFTDVTQLKLQQRRREEMMDYISHDLRSPMSSIITLSSKALDENPDNEYAQAVKSYAERNLQYANNFLDFSRAEFVSEKDMRDVNFVDVVEQARDAMLPVAQAASVSIDFTTSLEEAWVIAAPELIEKAIQNLIDNALKYSHEGGAVYVSVTEQENQYVCKVKDEGEGISEANLKRIFNPFEQLENSLPGKGLGLKIVDLVARKHEGSVSVSSSIGQGAEFIFSLPKAPD